MEAEAQQVVERRRSRTCPGALDAPATMMPRGWKSGAKRARTRVVGERRGRGAGAGTRLAELDQRVDRDRLPSRTISGFRSTLATSGRSSARRARPTSTSASASRSTAGSPRKALEQMRARARPIRQRARLGRAERRRREDDVARAPRSGCRRARASRTGRTAGRAPARRSARAVPRTCSATSSATVAVLGTRQREQLARRGARPRAASARPRRTSSRSVLCAIASPQSFSTTGKPSCGARPRRGGRTIARAPRARTARRSARAAPSRRARRACGRGRRGRDPRAELAARRGPRVYSRRTRPSDLPIRGAVPSHGARRTASSRSSSASSRTSSSPARRGDLLRRRLLGATTADDPARRRAVADLRRASSSRCASASSTCAASATRSTACAAATRAADETGEISHFQALSAALSGTVGLGNIAGVAVAVGIGGPGAVFWMIVAGFLGMTSKFAEVTLAQRFRVAAQRTATSPAAACTTCATASREQGLPTLGARARRRLRGDVHRRQLRRRQHVPGEPDLRADRERGAASASLARRAPARSASGCCSRCWSGS